MANGFDRLRMRLGSLLGQTHGGARDLYTVLGYPQVVDVTMLLNLYMRNDIAERIVRAFPQATWREWPSIRDEVGDSSEELKTDGSPNPSFSPFVKSVEDFFEKHRVMQYLERVDRLSGIGRFGILFMGFQDGLNADQPVKTGKSNLLYMTAYHEANVTVGSYIQDKQDPRYGLPEVYTLKAASSLGGQAVATTSIRAHWTRVLHVAEHLDENEVFGTPRLLSVYNRMLDLEKVVGSSAETFWLNARGGLSLMADKDVNLGTDQLADMKEQAEEWEHQLRRTIAMQGVTASMLQTIIADPKPNVETLLQLIAGAKGIPMRILVGSERGELSSSQDENNWAARIDERQNNFASPSILKPFVQKMIDTGNIERPGGDRGFWVEWPDSSALSPQAQAEVGDKKAGALQKYVMSPGAELVVPIQEFRTDILGLPPESDYKEEEEPVDETDAEGADQFDQSKTPFLLAPPVAAKANAIARMNRGIKAHAAPRTLYVSRNVLNADEIREHFKAQLAGAPMTPSDEMHVTIAYSRAKVDWFKVGTNWFSPADADGHLTVAAGGPRQMALFGPDKACLVMMFASSDLSWRHRDLKDAGCSWDYPEYQPHLTITYQFGDEAGIRSEDRLATITPYQGKIEFGPEIFAEVTSGWGDDLKENRREEKVDS